MPITWDDSGSGQGAVGAGVGVGAAAVAMSGLDKGAMDKMAAETREMVASARSGGFRVSENAAEPVRKTLAEMQTRVEELRNDLYYRFSVEPQLGGHDYGKNVATHQQKAASGADGSAMWVLNQLRQVLADADSALAIAVRKYRENEESASGTFGNGQV